MGDMVYIKVYKDFISIAEALDNGQRGRLFLAMLQYINGIEPEGLSGAEYIAFLTIKNQIDRDQSEYSAWSETNRENGRKGGRPKKPNGFEENRKNRTVFEEKPKNPKKEKEEEKEEDKDKEKDKEEGESARACARETPPTVSMVMDYAREIGADGFDADTFVNYHSQNGWLIRGSPMQDWRASVRLWVARDREREKTNPALQYQQREYKEQDSESFFIDLEKEYGNEQLR